VRRKSGRARPELRFVKAISFDTTVGSRSKFNRRFRRPFSIMDVDSMLGEKEVLSRLRKVTFRKDHSFRKEV
jgi:hypothetical protein